MAIIHFVKDEHGQEPVFELIRSIALKGMEDEGYANLAKYIAQALDYLEDVGVPDKKLLPFYTRRDDGRPLTFATILKELKHHPPLLEFRVNWRGTGYFRAIFFCEEDGGEQILHFTRAILKQEKNPPEFEWLIQESEQIVKAYSQKPE